MIELKAGCVRVLQNRKHLFNQQLPFFARVGEMSVEGVDSVREGSGKFDFLNPSPPPFLPPPPPPPPNAKDEPRRGFFFQQFSTLLPLYSMSAHFVMKPRLP